MNWLSEQRFRLLAILLIAQRIKMVSVTPKRTLAFLDGASKGNGAKLAVTYWRFLAFRV